MKKMLFGILSLLIITGCKPKTVMLKDSLKVEINEVFKISSLISENNEVEVINKDEIIDTSKLGDKEITIKYKVNDEEKEIISKVVIVDTKKPEINSKDKLETYQNVKIDLLKDVKVSDNSKEDIKIKVKGEYDFSKVGIYNLKYVAVDSSNNVTEKDFVLEVKKQNDYALVGKTKLYFGKYKLYGDVGDYRGKGTITIKADGTATNSGYYYNSKGNFVKKNLTGTWHFSANSVAGLSGAPEDLSKVDGIYFKWKETKETIGFGLSDKWFGDQFQVYNWYSK